MAERCDLDAPDEDIDDSPCDGVLIDMSGRGNAKVAGRLGDPFAVNALRNGDACPSTFQEIIDKLDDNQERCRTLTHVISEHASTLQQAMSDSEAASKSGYRTVPARRCGDEARPGILFSQFGIESGGDAPEDVEVIAFDEAQGVFNYYKIHDDGTFGFFGSSRDFLDGNGASISVNDTATSERDCARCHVGGGLIMKELDAPWVHWHQSKLAGAREVVEANSDLYGDLAVAVNLEGTVKNRNRAWNEVRIDHIRKNQTLKDLLRPLFCTQEINIESPGNPAFASLVNSRVGFVSLDSSGPEYGRLKAEFEQQMITGAGSPDVDDTSQEFTMVERANIDRDYVSKLVDQKLVDEAFVLSVLMVDFTRPVFSPDRCDLLEHAPDISITNKQGLPKKIRDGFIDNLEGRTSAARELRRNLVSSKGSSSPRSFFRPAVDKFEQACQARTSDESSDESGEELMRDLMTYFSRARSDARAMEILEFPGTLAHDKFDDGSGSTIDARTRLSPSSCNLVTRFIGVADPAADE